MSDLDPHILVVDDDTRLRELLRKYLSENGYRVTPRATRLTRAPGSPGSPSTCW